MAGDRRLQRGGQVVDTGKSPTPTPKVESATKGKWKASTMSCGQLDRLSTAGYLAPLEIAFTRPGLTSVNDVVMPETTPIRLRTNRYASCLFSSAGWGFQLILWSGASSIFTASSSTIFPPTSQNNMPKRILESEGRTSPKGS